MHIPFSILLQQASNPSRSSWSVVRSATVERNIQVARQIIIGFKPGFGQMAAIKPNKHASMAQVLK
jgi:hypothetical protein